MLHKSFATLYWREKCTIMQMYIKRNLEIRLIYHDLNFVGQGGRYIFFRMHFIIPNRYCDTRNFLYIYFALKFESLEKRRMQLYFYYAILQGDFTEIDFFSKKFDFL